MGKAKKKRALITGITGQDGSYLTELLLGMGYEVHGIVRRVAAENKEQRLGRINHLVTQIKIHPGSIEDYGSVVKIIDEVQPDEGYHLAAQSFVAESFDDPFSAFNINIGGTLNVLEAIRNRCPKCKLYFAGSSEMFGLAREAPQNENTVFHPRSPYGVTKATGFNLVRNYRESHHLFCCSGILFNHESPRRGLEFVTRKISFSVAKIFTGSQEKLVLGDLTPRRDWGFSGDYVRAMWLMLQQDQPDDFVIATGETHTVQEFVEAAFTHAGLDWRRHTETNQQFVRPAEVPILLGDYSKAKQKLGWEPKIKFQELVEMMVGADIALLTGASL